MQVPPGDGSLRPAAIGAAERPVVVGKPGIAGGAKGPQFKEGWKKQVRSAVLHVVALAQYAATSTRGWGRGLHNTRVRLKAEWDRANQELLLLREEIRIKDARLARIAPHRRPHYPPTERMAILQLKATRAWSLEQTARVFQLTAATVASWLKRVDEQGPDALVQLREPVNKFPDFVRYVVQRLKTLCPSMGKKKLAETLARAGLHLGTTTVGRMLKEKPARPPALEEEADSTDRVVTAKYPEPRLARRPHDGADRCGLLVLLAPFRPAAVLAVLLVGAGRGRSFLASRHGCRRLREATRLPRGVHAAWDRCSIAWGRLPSTSCVIATASSTARRSGDGSSAKASNHPGTGPSASTAASPWWSDSS